MVAVLVNWALNKRGECINSLMMLLKILSLFLPISIALVGNE